jgi:hypothetical protein
VGMIHRVKVLELALEDTCHYIDPCEVIDWEKFGKGSEYMNEFFIAQAEAQLAQQEQGENEE